MCNRESERKIKGNSYEGGFRDGVYEGSKNKWTMREAYGNENEGFDYWPLILMEV